MNKATKQMTKLFAAMAMAGVASYSVAADTIKIALAGPANRLDIELEFAAWLVKGHQRAGFDLLAIFQSPAEQLGAISPHHATHLGGAVLEREIDVAGGRVGQVRDFPADPGQRKGGFEAVAHQAVEAGNAEYGVTDRRAWARHRWIVTRRLSAWRVVDRSKIMQVIDF